MLDFMRTKSLESQRNEAARTFIKSIVDRDFAGNTSAASRKFGISQSMLSEFLAGGRGAGMKLLDAVAIYSGATVDQILGRGSEPPPPPPALPSTNLEIALAYLGAAVSPEAIEIVKAATTDLDTSSWLPIRWGRELTRVQRELLEADGVELPPEAGAVRGRQRPAPPPPPLVTVAEPVKRYRKLG